MNNLLLNNKFSRSNFLKGDSIMLSKVTVLFKICNFLNWTGCIIFAIGIGMLSISPDQFFVAFTKRYSPSVGGDQPADIAGIGVIDHSNNLRRSSDICGRVVYFRFGKIG